MSSTWTFVRNFFTRFHHTGAILPSSRGLARAMTGPLALREARSLRVLEVGAGTGVFTREILSKLGPGDSLRIYEINPEFCDLLRREFLPSPRDAGPGPVVELVEGDVRAEAAEGAGYDFIVSGLPFNNFEPGFVEEILSLYLRLLLSGGTLSFFEYIGVRQGKLRLPLARSEWERLHRVEGVVAGLARRFEQKRVAVWANIPPAWVRIWQRSPVHSAGEAPPGNASGNARD